MASRVSRADWAATVPWAGVLDKPASLGGVSDISKLAAAGYGAGKVPLWNGRAFVPTGLPIITPPTQPVVVLTMPDIFSVAYSLDIGPETIIVTLGTQAANLAFMGPATGAAAIPAFRAFAGADFPALVLPIGSINASGTPSISTYLRGDGSWASSPVPALTNTHLFVGNVSNVATDVALSGDATIDNTGAITVAKAAKWTTARNLAGNSVDGSAAVTFANKFIVQGTADAGLSGPQFLGALATGILKNTITTGVLSIAAAGDFPALPYAPAALTSAYLFVGNVSNVATGVAMTGDISITNAGLTAIGANKVTLAMMALIANNTVLGNISGGVAVPSALTALAGLTAYGIRDTSAAYDVQLGATSSVALAGNRALTFDVTNAARTIKLTGNTVLDQDVSTAGSPTFNIPQFTRLGLGMTNTGSAQLEIKSLSGGGINVTANTTTDPVMFRFINGGGTCYFGVDDSAGGSFVGHPYSLNFYVSGAYPIDFATNNTRRGGFAGNSGNFDCTGSLTTGAPTGGTAGAWKLGIKVDAVSALDAAHYLQVDVGGVAYKLALIA